MEKETRGISSSIDNTKCGTVEKLSAAYLQSESHRKALEIFKRPPYYCDHSRKKHGL